MSCGVYLKYFSLIRVNCVKVKNIKNHGTQEVYPEIRRYVKWRALLLKVDNYCCKALHCSYLRRSWLHLCHTGCYYFRKGEKARCLES